MFQNLAVVLIENTGLQVYPHDITSGYKECKKAYFQFLPGFSIIGQPAPVQSNLIPECVRADPAGAKLKSSA